MKKILFILSLFILVGAGCAKSEKSTSTNNPVSNVEIEATDESGNMIQLETNAINSNDSNVKTEVKISEKPVEYDEDGVPVYEVNLQKVEK